MPSSLGTPHSLQSPRLQLSFPPTPALHLDIPRRSDEDTSPIVPSSATNTEHDFDGGFHTQIFEKVVKTEKDGLTLEDSNYKK